MRTASKLTIVASFAAGMLGCTSSPTGNWSSDASVPWGMGGSASGNGGGAGAYAGGAGGVYAGGGAGVYTGGGAGNGAGGAAGLDGGTTGCIAGLPCARFLADLNPGPNGSVVGQFAEFRGKSHFFAVGSGSGLTLSLWSTDGTSAGTKRLLDAPARSIDSGTYNSRPVVFNDRLYFLAWPADIGQEIFAYDGVAITAIEANPGPLHSWDVAAPFLATTSKAVVWQGRQPGENTR